MKKAVRGLRTGPVLWALSCIVAMAPGCGSARGVPPRGHPDVAKGAASSDGRTGPTMAALLDADELPRAPEPPLGLTASDGTGLRLARLEARAVVQDPLAFTELHLAFENPEDRRLEGTFRITLPPGAAVARFAMKIEDRWQEAEVVPLARAREVYEDFLHVKQDPALLEQAAANEFSARVFPILPHAVKELVVSYVQEVGDSFAVPLRGLPELDKLTVGISVGSLPKPAVALDEVHDAPTADATLDPSYLSPAGARAEGVRSGGLALVRVRLHVDERPDPVASAVVLVDTSASRALDFAEEVREVESLVRELAERASPQTPLSVACFDQSVEPVFRGEAGAFGKAEVGRIRARQALGASDLGRALAWAHDEAARAGAKRLVLVTDGVATAGSVEADAVLAGARGLKSAGVERLDVVRVGGIRDDAVLRRLVTSGLARDGVVIDGALPAGVVARRLLQATRSGIAVKVDGAIWSWPRTLDGIQPGDERLVYAEVPRAAPVRVEVDGAAVWSPKLGSVEQPLLERAWAAAKVRDLEERTDAASKAPRELEIAAFSVAHRVVGPGTGMLVLETEGDYARFGLDRRAATDVLELEEGRLVRTKRSRVVVAASRKEGTGPLLPMPSQRPPETAEPAVGNMWGETIEDAFGAVGLGLRGAGEGGIGTGAGTVGTVGHGSGFGRGSGRLGGSHRVVSPPRIREAAVAVSGRLPPEVIQRIVRQNFGRFRLCYENGLRNNPRLEGRVAVRFVIDPAGAVAQAVDGGSDLGDASVVACVAHAFTNLAFPVPEGGIVTVVYPIVFTRQPTETPPERLAVMSTVPSRPEPPEPPPPEEPAPAAPYEGNFKLVMDALAEEGPEAGLRAAAAWHKSDPGNVMALVALGEALERAGDVDRAARAYGSIVDLFPARADLRRFAGERLERLGGAGLDLATDTYAKAKAERPDHASGYRLLAYAWLKQHEYEKAFAAAEEGLKHPYPWGRFAGVTRVLAEDLGLIGAAWIAREPSRAAAVATRLRDDGASLESAPSVRFVLTWETDSNDVDLHVFDAQGGHAFFRRPALASGGTLYADVTTGYGPECFTIRHPKDERAGPYTLQAHYYARGPMGYGMGKLEIVEHDGKGGLRFEERPFVVMADQAFVDLGTFG